MPFDKNNKYYLDDVYYRNITPAVYGRCKRIAEDRMQTQSSFEGMIRLFEDCGYTAQVAILKILE